MGSHTNNNGLNLQSGCMIEWVTQPHSASFCSLLAYMEGQFGASSLYGSQVRWAYVSCMLCISRRSVNQWFLGQSVLFAYSMSKWRPLIRSQIGLSVVNKVLYIVSFHHSFISCLDKIVCLSRGVSS